MILEFLKVVLLGIVEGITEWLPISSTGHMILVDEFVHLQVTDAFMEMFMVVIQLGAILAVVALYFKKLNPFSPKKTEKEKLSTWRLWIMIVIGSIPSGIVGLLVNEWIDSVFYNYITVAITLIVYGIGFIVVEKRKKDVTPEVRSLGRISWQKALGIGVFQTLALIPGTSRSGATILGGMLLGMSRTVAAEYTFYLAIPAMFGASFLKLLKFGFVMTAMEAGLLIVGMAVSFAVSWFAIKFLMSYIRKHDFTAFGWYRIVLGVLVLAYFAIRTAIAA